MIIFILLLGLFFRLYNLEIFYPWGHDQDLFAWIAKDIIIDDHLRLIGQETSIIGVFIGPIFYYLVAFSMALFNMNPLAANIPTTIISLLAIFSIYFVFAKFFGKRAGLIGAFLYAVSPGIVFLDRWVVPTQPTILWGIWYLYILFSILKGNIQIFIPLSILIGLIWHVHIAFIPLLILLPLAYFYGDRKSYKFKHSFRTLAISAVLLLILTAPFFIFEARHNFIQTKSLLTATYQDRGDLTGIERVAKVINSGGRSLAGAFVLSNTVIELNSQLTTVLPFLLLLGILYLYASKSLIKNQTIIIIAWITVVFLSQLLSKRIITEYYFNNLFVILFLVLAIILSKIHYSFQKVPLVVIFLFTYLIFVLSWLISRPDDMGGFLYKREAIEYIKKDVVAKGYPCIGISHIENHTGGPTGYRYLFWLNKLPLITPGTDVPVYNIVHPWTISLPEITAKFGEIGVIIPTAKNIDSNICSDPSRKLLPLWGFTN